MSVAGNTLKQVFWCNHQSPSVTVIIHSRLLKVHLTGTYHHSVLTVQLCPVKSSTRLMQRYIVIVSKCPDFALEQYGGFLEQYKYEDNLKQQTRKIEVVGDLPDITEVTRQIFTNLKVCNNFDLDMAEETALGKRKQRDDASASAHSK